MGRTYIIAEIGTSHQGSTDSLETLIKAAAESGADCAKFQHVYAHEIIHPNTGLVPLPTGSIPLYETFRRLETNKSFFVTAKQLCERYHVDFLCTPFGLDSSRELQEIGVSAFKIASPELNHHPLVRQLASYQVPLIISSGVSTLSDIDETLQLLQSLGHNKALTLLHCITSYPAPEEEFNLLLIRTLSDIFGIDVGLSDHSLDPVLVPFISVLLGATTIEKHFTLSKSTDGLDDPIALTPLEFKSMVDSIRKLEDSTDLMTIRKYRSRTELLDLLETILARHSIPIERCRLDLILGSGVKRLAQSERTNYGRTNRSIHALYDLKKGSVLTKEDLIVVRTEKILRPGLHPRYLDILPGRVCKQDIPEGEGIRWEDIE